MTYHENTAAVEAAPQKLTRHQRYHDAHREKALANRREYYRVLKAAGTCTECSSEPARPGRIRCLGCTRQQADRQRQGRGVSKTIACGNCGVEGHNRRTCPEPTKAAKPPGPPRAPRPFLPPHLRAQARATRQHLYYVAHRERYVSRARANYAALKAKGICTHCCAEPSLPNRVRCAGCASDHLAREKARRGSPRTFTCGACGKEGHNVRTCERSGRAAAARGVRTVLPRRSP